MKIEKLPLEMSLRDLKNILGDLGFDPKLFISKILEVDDHKVAIVKIVEDRANFPTKMDELETLEINGNPVDFSILDEEEISKLELDKKTLAKFYVSLEFCKFAEIPTQAEVEKKILQVGLESAQKLEKPGPSSFSMIVTGKSEEKKKIKTALRALEFGENITVSVKDIKRKSFAVKVTRGDPSIRLTNLPLDCDSKILRAAIRKTLEFEFGIRNCKDGTAEISYSAREMDLLDKLEGMKIGNNEVKVVGEKMDDKYVVPEDWTEDKMKEVLGMEKLVPLEIKVKDEKLALLFKPTKENLSKIIQELAKLRPQPEKPVEEEKVKAEEEELKEKESNEKKESKEEKGEKESKDDGGEKEEAPQMIDGKPVVFASMDIREKKKAQAQAEKDKQENKENNVKEVTEI